VVVVIIFRRGKRRLTPGTVGHPQGECKEFCFGMPRSGARDWTGGGTRAGTLPLLRAPKIRGQSTIARRGAYVPQTAKSASGERKQTWQSAVRAPQGTGRGPEGRTGAGGRNGTGNGVIMRKQARHGMGARAGHPPTAACGVAALDCGSLLPLSRAHKICGQGTIARRGAYVPQTAKSASGEGKQTLERGSRLGSLRYVWRFCFMPFPNQNQPKKRSWPPSTPEACQPLAGG
jgi:hypothetical protein